MTRHTLALYLRQILFPFQCPSLHHHQPHYQIIVIFISKCNRFLEKRLKQDSLLKSHMRYSGGQMGLKLRYLVNKIQVPSFASKGTSPKRKTFFQDFDLNCGWVGVKSPKLLSKKTMSCLYGIFYHSKHIICSWFFSIQPVSFRKVLNPWGPLFRSKS